MADSTTANVAGTAIAGYGSAMSYGGAAAGDLLGMQGNISGAASYDEAAAMARQNAMIAQQGIEIQKTQEQRQIYKAIGSQQAGFASAGFAKSGSALDIMRSSLMQGELAKAAGAQQGAIQVNAYKEQAANYNRMAEASRFAAAAQETAAGQQKRAQIASEVGTIIAIAALL